jgi:hypothetical protein
MKIGKIAKKGASGFGDLAKAVRKRAKAGGKRFGRFGRSGVSQAEAMAVELAEAAGGRAIDHAAAYIGGSHAAQRLDAVAARGIHGARALAGRHPLRAVMILGAGAALIQAQFGLGVLAGVGAAALVVTRNGQSTRFLIATGGKRALASACGAYNKRRGLSAFA